MSNGQVERGGGEAISVLADKLDRYTAGWFPPSNELNTQRCAIPVSYTHLVGDHPFAHRRK